MMFRKNKGFAIAIICAGLVGAAMQVKALPNVTEGTGHSKHPALRTTAAACQPATATIDLDINNVRARLMTGGDMWWNIGTAKAAYEVPKGGGASSLFAGSCWIGGFDKQGQLKVAAQTYRQDGNDYWPGALDRSNTITTAQCASWDRFWKVNKSDILSFIALKASGGSTSGSQFDVINQWPAAGNSNVYDANGQILGLVSGRTYAPFVDKNGNGIYEPDQGDYPDINGDQFIWWVFNDVGNIKQQTQTASIGLEVQASAFAYSTNDALNDATFYNYHITNRGTNILDSAYITTWSDADLGYAFDDYIGCDTTRGLGILYNGKTIDGSGSAGEYGSHIPMVGVDFFKGPIRKITDPVTGKQKDSTLTMTVFDYYNNDFSNIGNPTNGVEIYNYMTGSIRKGQRFSNDFSGPGVNSTGFGKGPISRFVFTGNPETGSGEWSECVCQNVPGDRRFIHSSGPFTLNSGDVQDVTIGAVWVPNVGGCPNTSFKGIRAADDAAQALFDANFKTIEGPNAPRMVVRELNRKVVFYLLNDANSNNFREQYGYLDSPKYRVASTKAAKYVHAADSLYKFEGYRVFQLADGSVTPAQIYNSQGEVDPTKAVEVFECDIRNGVTRIINYTKRTDISDTTWVPQIKVNGKDSGIVHSFELTQDAFASGNDKTLVNYKSYYYVAIAYAYNNFSPFNAKHTDSTQELAYIESSHGQGGVPVPVDTVIPNPAYGNMGTVLNADYGSGVIIKRRSGTGNGGNILQLSQSSENEALSSQSGYISRYPTYVSGSSPVDVKVIDPVKVKPADWELYIDGALNTPNDKGIIPDSGSWTLVAKPTDGSLPDTIYSQVNLNILNEQIVEKYGISVNVKQVLRPGDDQPNGNGYITSDITFADPSNPWLAGVPDQAGTDPRNWMRSGNPGAGDTTIFCDFTISGAKYDSMLAYQYLLSNNSNTVSSWAPYSLGGVALYHTWLGQTNASACGWGVALKNTQPGLDSLYSVDLVFTNDKSKWSKCIVLEEQEDPALAENSVPKFGLRNHLGWTGNVDNYGTPIYDQDTNKVGTSWFPGYAINQETGERVNIVFGEDSWLKQENGADMIWDPTSTVLNSTGDIVFGGKHYIYLTNTRYDGDSINRIKLRGSTTLKSQVFRTFQWVGVPLLNSISHFLPLAQGEIPTETRIRIRVARPYAYYNPTDPNYLINRVNTPVAADADTLPNHGLPSYSFSTADLAPMPVNNNTDKNALLKRIQPVPNPYYGYAGYEASRLDTRVRIINLPAHASVNIYSLDGTLIRTLTKADPNVSYLDWDLRNSAGLQIASGMYLMDVKADGIGETVLRWFGALRPIDATQY